jgi:hypothetical protein
MPEYPDSYSIGMSGAVLSAIGILTSGPLAVLVVVLVHPQPPWNGPALFVANFHHIQTLPFYFGFLLVSGSILMLVSIYRLAKQRATALAALIFMSIGAAFAILNYVVQTTFIPAVVDTYSSELDSVIGVYSMANPGSLPWALEMWGYGFMGLGTWLAAGFFDTSRLERVAKTLFVLNGVVSVLGALAVSIDLSGVFSIAGLVGYGAWNVLYLALAVVFYRVLQKRRDRVKCQL